MVPIILIIDDEEHMCWALSKAMQQEGYRVATATSAREGLDYLHRNNVSLVITDLKMPDISGLDVLKTVKEDFPKMPVIIITAHGSIQTAIEAMKMGAADYITKPFDLDELKIVVKKTLQVSKLLTEVSFLRSELTRSHGQMIGKSPAFEQVRTLISRVAPTEATVLLTGESGTGKEVAAVAIHQLSNRHEGPFVAVNCAALPEHLLESELFGHERGAFTGATTRKLGRFQLADKGTIFLDEIAEMSPAMQAKLLRVLQDQTFERVGGTETLRIDTRIIAATNRDLTNLVKEGGFREDLYYRLNVIEVHLPPLRKRKNDIPLLAQYFMSQFRSIYVSGSINQQAMEMLMQYHWPGNIRELKNVIERAMILSQGTTIGPEHLPKELHHTRRQPGAIFLDIPDDGISLEGVEKTLLMKALEKSGGNQTKAAALLKITRSTLLYRMQKFGLQ